MRRHWRGGGQSRVFGRAVEKRRVRSTPFTGTQGGGWEPPAGAGTRTQGCRECWVRCPGGWRRAREGGGGGWTRATGAKTSLWEWDERVERAGPGARSRARSRLPCHPRTHAHTGPTNAATAAAVAAPPSAAPATSFTRASLSKGRATPSAAQRRGREGGNPPPFARGPGSPPHHPLTHRPPAAPGPARLCVGPIPGAPSPRYPTADACVGGGGEPWRIFLGASVKKGEEREDGRGGGRGEGQRDAHSTKKPAPLHLSPPPLPFQPRARPWRAAPAAPSRCRVVGSLHAAPSAWGVFTDAGQGAGSARTPPPLKLWLEKKKRVRSADAFSAGGRAPPCQACGPGTPTHPAPHPPRPSPACAAPPRPCQLRGGRFQIGGWRAEEQRKKNDGGRPGARGPRCSLARCCSHSPPLPPFPRPPLQPSCPVSPTMVGEVIDVRVRCTGRPSLGVEERGGAGGKKGARPGGVGAPREGRAIGREERKKKNRTSTSRALFLSPAPPAAIAAPSPTSPHPLPPHRWWRSPLLRPCWT